MVNQQHAFTNIIENYDEHVEGNLICDKTARNWDLNTTSNKIKNLQYLCKNC